MTTMRIRTDGDYAWRKDLVNDVGLLDAVEPKPLVVVSLDISE